MARFVFRLPPLLPEQDELIRRTRRVSFAVGPHPRLQSQFMRLLRWDSLAHANEADSLNRRVKSPFGLPLQATRRQRRP